LAKPDLHWKKNYSAMSIAMSWHDAVGFPATIARVFTRAGLPFSELEPLLIIPEHRVPLPGGSRSSQSDVWVLARNANHLVSISVEGKVGESFGPTIKEWLIGAGDGKRERLSYIRKQLGLREEVPPEIRYQLLHRCASAVIEASRFNAPLALFLVQSFNAADTGFYDYDAFVKLFGRTAVPDQIVHLGVENGVSTYAAWIRDPIPLPPALPLTGKKRARLRKRRQTNA
jgi:hypothetical protein